MTKRRQRPVDTRFTRHNGELWPTWEAAVALEEKIAHRRGDLTDEDLELAGRLAHAYNSLGWVATKDAKPRDGQRVRAWDSNFRCERFLVYRGGTWEDDFGELLPYAPSHWTPEWAPPGPDRPQVSG